MSKTEELIEAQLLTAFADELCSMQKRANLLTTVGKGAIRAAGAVKEIKAIGSAGKWIKNLPSQQLYRFTGYGGKGWSKMDDAQRATRLADLGIHGTHGARAPLIEAAEKAVAKPGMLGAKKKARLDALVAQYGTLNNAPTEAVAKALGSEGKTISATADAYASGMTTVPGYLKSLVKHPLKTLKTGWHSEGTTGKALAGGFAAADAYEIATAPEGEKLQTALHKIPAAVLYATTGPVGFLGQVAIADTTSAALNKGVTALTKKKSELGRVVPTSEVAQPPKTTL